MNRFPLLLIFVTNYEENNPQSYHVRHWLFRLLSSCYFGNRWRILFVVFTAKTLRASMALGEGFVQKFLQRRAFDIFMFGYVDGIHTEFPSVSIRKAITMFRKRYELEPDDFNEESAYSTYNRMKAEIKEFDRERKSAA